MPFYHMMIYRYGRCIDCHTEQEMRDELGRYITEQEKKSGIVDRLLSFGEPNKYGYSENSWRDITVRKFF